MVLEKDKYSIYVLFTVNNEAKIELFICSPLVSRKPEVTVSLNEARKHILFSLYIYFFASQSD